MAIFWMAVLAVMYVGMEHFLQPSAALVKADGSVELQRHRDGHFYVDGAINGQPVRFLVDTGASTIAVTDSLAAKAGLHGGQEVQFRTANGVRAGRLVRAQHVQVGPFQAQNLTVGTGYTGTSEQDALLGQNFLRQFEVLMRGDVLLLRAKSKS